jgi:hypothetical protein
VIYLQRCWEIKKYNNNNNNNNNNNSNNNIWKLRYWISSGAVTLERSAGRRSDKPVKNL